MNSFRSTLVGAAALMTLLGCTRVNAANPFGLYIGAGAGHSHVRVDGPVHFDETDTGWTAFAGIRPLPFLGAEFQYLDFGHPSTTIGPFHDASLARAAALFATGNLSLPFVDLYAKAGFGRLETEVTQTSSLPVLCISSFPQCADFRSEATDIRFGWGLGAQLKLFSLGVRGEYVRFDAANGDPDLLSLSVVWKFD